MDRHDERKDNRLHDDATRVPDPNTDRDDDAREGDVLGLGGSAVPKAPGDPTTEYDEESIAKRRARSAAGEARLDRRDHDLERGKGATGIDMGSGGTGTDIERE